MINLESRKGIIIIVLVAFVVFGILINLIHLFEGPSPKETTYVTLVFKDRDEVEGILGIGGENPTILMRSSRYHQMEFRVVNGDDEPHQLVIESIASSRLLQPGDMDIFILSGGERGKYRYYDATTNTTLGEFWIVRVTALDD